MTFDMMPSSNALRVVLRTILTNFTHGQNSFLHFEARAPGLSSAPLTYSLTPLTDICLMHTTLETRTHTHMQLVTPSPPTGVQPVCCEQPSARKRVPVCATDGGRGGCHDGTHAWGRGAS